MIRLHPLVGHEEARAALAAAHLRGELPHALLFHGMRGAGKQRLALWTAQLRVCEEPGPDGPCGACRSCRLALGIEHPDIHWYFPLPRPKGVSGPRLGDALESARIDRLVEIREEPLSAGVDGEVRGLYLATVQQLRRRAQVAPTMAAVQTFIVSEAELLVPQESSPEAANALLKLLEEPPPRTTLVLTSSEPGLLLPTIRSRAVPFHVGRLPTGTVADFLAEHAGVARDEAERAAALGQGSVGRALGFLGDGDGDPGPLEQLRRQALEIVRAALAPDRAAGHAVALGYPLTGARALVPLVSAVEDWLRDLGAVAAGAPGGLLNPDHAETLETLQRAAGVEASDVPTALLATEEARELARGNVNPQLLVSGLVRRLRAALRPRRIPLHAPGPGSRAG